LNIWHAIIHAIAWILEPDATLTKTSLSFSISIISLTDFKGEQTTGVKNLHPLPTFEIQRPKPELIGALKIIIENNGKIQKKQMAELAEKENLITVNAREENYTQARFASLDKNIIQPLQEEWKFIKVEKIGRNRWIKVTQEGINAAEFLV